MGRLPEEGSPFQMQSPARVHAPAPPPAGGVVAVAVPLQSEPLNPASHEHVQLGRLPEGLPRLLQSSFLVHGDGEPGPSRRGKKLPAADGVVSVASRTAKSAAPVRIAARSRRSAICLR